MNVFLINGSPKGKKSNTYRLSEAFLAGLNQEQHINCREANLSALNIKPCLGCFSCWNRTPGSCCLHDDMAGMIENLLWADVIVWSFPLYYFGVPGPLKNFIDRQLPMVLPFMTSDSESGGHPTRYDLSAKRHVLISTCGFYTAEGNYDGVNAMFDHMLGKGEYTSIYCGQGELFRVKELSGRTGEYLNWVKRAGSEFSQGNISRETKAALSQLLFPREVFEAMADASWGIEKTGEQTEESLVFTRQMAALYNRSAWAGKDQVLEMYYTDIDRRYQILLTQEGSQVLTEDFRKPTTTIETPYTLWKAIAAEEENGEQALMDHKYRVTGDFKLMVNWDRWFGSQDFQAPAASGSGKKTSMLLMLLPWILFWSLSSAFPQWGPVIAVYSSVVLPLLFRKCKMLVYDHISAAAVTACALVVLLGVKLEWMLTASYLCFGIMWTIGGFRPIPLTAHYSINDYSANMITNPIFLKTNKILTLSWGILYLILPAVSLLTIVVPALSWINGIFGFAPPILGIFTLWFQKWYPAHVGRG